MNNIVLQDLAMNREMFHVAEAELDADDINQTGLNWFDGAYIWIIQYSCTAGPGNEMFHVTTAELDRDDSKWTGLDCFNS